MERWQSGLLHFPAVSVPIRGLCNLTAKRLQEGEKLPIVEFPSPSGVFNLTEQRI